MYHYGERIMSQKNTHIPKLDDLLSGGIPEGKSLAFSADPGVPSHVFGYQVIAERLRENGGKGFIYTNSSSPATIKNEMRAYGWDIEKYLESEKLFFVDSASNRIGFPATGKYNIENDSEIKEKVIKAIEDIKGGTGVIVDVAMLLDSLGANATWGIIETWNKTALDNNVNLIFLFTKWDYEEEVLKKFEELVDCEVAIQPIVERVIFKQVFSVLKSNWTEPKDLKIFFECIKPGGVKAFIPKLLVTGPYNAGKTSFVSAISKKSVSVERQAYEDFPTTVALDFGFMDHRGFSADVFGTPGQERFDLLLETLAREAMGTFIIVDSTKPDTFSRAEEMIRLCKVEAVPKIIVANKQDMKEALSEDEIRKRMEIPEGVPIVLTSVKNRKGITESLDALLDLIYR
jgi:small GTP-binding protein